MSKLEYLNPIDWSLHVIDGENEGVPEGWVLVPEGADEYKSNGKFYKDNGKYFYSVLECWNLSSCSNYKNLWQRKIKEYLVERDGKYELVEAYHLDGGIEVPDGAQRYTEGGFFKNKKTWFSPAMRCWVEEENNSWVGFNDILWQRKPSLNDKYAEIKKVRQGGLKGVLDRADIFCKETSKHHHYFKNVENLNMIDVYRVLELFNVKSHAVGHAVKKLLCSGGRGSKDYLQDIQEAIDSLQREIEMKKEDCK